MGTYPGGKNGSGVVQTIINQIPPHSFYLEPFAGSAAVYRAKKPARESLLLDRDPCQVAALQAEGLPAQVGCALDYLEARAWTGEEFVYADPPYVGNARRSKDPIYRFEMMGEGEHRRLLDILKRVSSPVAISGYASELYSRELIGCRLVTFLGPTHQGPALEHLWCNYPEPLALHDYRFLGAGHTDRQRIRRKQARWVRKLQGLPRLEQQALLAAIEEWRWGD